MSGKYDYIISSAETLSLWHSNRYQEEHKSGIVSILREFLWRDTPRKKLFQVRLSVEKSSGNPSSTYKDPSTHISINRYQWVNPKRINVAWWIPQNNGPILTRNTLGLCSKYVISEITLPKNQTSYHNHFVAFEKLWHLLAACGGDSNYNAPLIAEFMEPRWSPSWVDRTHVGPMLAPWTLLSGHGTREVSIPLVWDHHTEPCNWNADQGSRRSLGWDLCMIYIQNM